VVRKRCKLMASKKTEPRSTRRTFGRLRQFRSGRWKASYTGPDGKLYEADHTFAAKIDAEAWLTDRRREIDRELWSPPASAEQKREAADRKRAATETFDDHAKRWLEARTVKGRPLKPRTREHYQDLLNRHILPTFRARPIRDITMESVDRWHAKTATNAPTTRAHAYSLLRTILETARTRDRLIDVNPCLIRGAGNVDRVVAPKPATLEQVDSITEAMPEGLRVMVLLATWCAMRFGELVELRRGDVNMKAGVVSITRGVSRVTGGHVVGGPKSDAGVRDVAIPPHILPAVMAHLKGVGGGADALLFLAKSGRHLQPSTFYRHYYKARAAAGRAFCEVVGEFGQVLVVFLGGSGPYIAGRCVQMVSALDQKIAVTRSPWSAVSGHRFLAARRAQTRKSSPPRTTCGPKVIPRQASAGPGYLRDTPLVTKPDPLRTGIRCATG
jgi:integrase